MRYEIKIIIKASDRTIARDITNLIKESIENQPYLDKELKLLDIGYIKTKKETVFDKDLTQKWIVYKLKWEYHGYKGDMFYSQINMLEDKINLLCDKGYKILGIDLIYNIY